MASATAVPNFAQSIVEIGRGIFLNVVQKSNWTRAAIEGPGTGRDEIVSICGVG